MPIKNKELKACSFKVCGAIDVDSRRGLKVKDWKRAISGRTFGAGEVRRCNGQLQEACCVPIATATYRKHKSCCRSAHVDYTFYIDLLLETSLNEQTTPNQHFSMSANKELVLPSTSKQEHRKTRDTSSIVPVSKENKELPELRNKSDMVDRSKPLPTSLQKDFIPEEVLVALTNAASPVPFPSHLRPPKKTKTVKDFQGCIRTVDGVWQHAVRRNKFKYLIQNPICLTGAGRDVSFLYDVIAAKGTKNPPPTPEPHKTSSGRSLKQQDDKLPAAIADSLVPEEFHLVKNRGVLGLEYYDDEYTTLLEDHENRLRIFPSMKPSGRLEVLQLMKVMDTMLEKAGVDNEEVGVAGLSQMHNVLELLKVEQNIYDIVFHEIIRQVSVDCAERGELLSKLRQRYVELLNRIPKQMRNLYKEIMAQRVMDKHITDELFNFKEAVGQLTRELRTIREHDHKATVEAEKAYQELAAAVRESEMNSNLLDEYRKLYELQRARLEAQIHQLTQEKELWSSATYELALKVIEKNKLILARRMYASEKAWTKAVKHFVILLESEELTQEFRELLVRIGIEVEQLEDNSRQRVKSIQNGLTGWLNYFQNHILGKGSYTYTKGSSFLDEVLVDLKIWEKMLNEELEQLGGDMLLMRQEPLKTAASLQKQWMELGIAVLSRHKDLNGMMPPELKTLEEIDKSSNYLWQQYSIRIGGENGSARILTGLVNSLEDWTFKMLASKQRSGMHETDWIKFFQTVTDWLAQMDDLLKFIGTTETPEDRRLKVINIQVIPEDVFKKIQQWILTTTSGAEKENIQLSQELTDFHNVLNKWMVNLLIHMVPDHITPESLPLTDAQVARQAEHKLLNIFRLEGEAIGLAAKLTKFSSYLVSCCKEMVASVTLRKMASYEPDAEYEVEQLEKIKTECLDWIDTCNLLLSGMKTSPTNLISTEELVNLFGTEVLQPKRELPPHPEDVMDSSLDQPVDSLKEHTKDEEDSAKGIAETKQVLETEQQPSTSTDQQAVSAEITFPVRYIGEDSNIHVRSMQMEEVTVSTRELYASQWTTKFSKKEFEMLASLEILEERLLEAEKRAQQAEEKSESLHEQLEEALTKIQDLEGAEPTEKSEEASKLQIVVPTGEKPDVPPPPSRKSSAPRTKKSTKPKR
ncbi:axonemal dynein light chain domain-containing protein 1 isoform X2 [Hemicordylus capensis]|uniref:axonemal dynein light chain domain-containing protein 1 isoform X2 n=1 Tax=Hemicordylus capensis TaxID=884348 RepID=UPI0023049628|nr:axonemal dynein light chain domain-containing protein 1 isoform X2 [Hemicordylus capensis]